MRHKAATRFPVFPAMMVGYGLWGWVGLLTVLGLPGGLMGLGWLNRKKQAPAFDGACTGSGINDEECPLQTVPPAALPADRASLDRKRLETLLTKAHRLALDGRDRFGVQTCCLNIIQKTEKEDPLCRRASDLYLRTVTTRSPHLPGERPADRTWSGPPENRKAPPPPTNIIPFPGSACRR
jgi:hypothetical protein